MENVNQNFPNPTKETVLNEYVLNSTFLYELQSFHVLRKVKHLPLIWSQESYMKVERSVLLIVLQTIATLDILSLQDRISTL